MNFTQYHIYSIEWDASSIKWFVDGTQYLEGNIANNINGTDAFHLPFFITLNLAVGGNWPGSPNASTTFPATMYVDYVRVYQDNGCAATTITPYVQINGGSWVQTSTASLASGGTVVLGPQPVSGGSWSWSGPNGL